MMSDHPVDCFDDDRCGGAASASEYANRNDVGPFCNTGGSSSDRASNVRAVAVAVIGIGVVCDPGQPIPPGVVVAATAFETITELFVR